MSLSFKKYASLQTFPRTLQCCDLTVQLAMNSIAVGLPRRMLSALQPLDFTTPDGGQTRMAEQQKVFKCPSLADMIMTPQVCSIPLFAISKVSKMMELPFISLPLSRIWNIHYICILFSWPRRVKEIADKCTNFDF